MTQGLEPEVRALLSNLHVELGTPVRMCQEYEKDWVKKGYVSVEAFHEMDIISDHTVVGMKYDEALFVWNKLGCQLKKTAARTQELEDEENAAAEAAAATNSKLSLFDRLGGDAAVEATVTVFYERILNDTKLAHWFEHMDTGRLMQKQRAFLTMAFGGKTRYDGRDLTSAHAGLVRNGLGDQEFDAVARHLQDSLAELKVPHDLIREVMQAVSALRGPVLGKDDGKVKTGATTVKELVSDLLCHSHFEGKLEGGSSSRAAVLLVTKGLDSGTVKDDEVDGAVSAAVSLGPGKREVVPVKIAARGQGPLTLSFYTKTATARGTMDKNGIITGVLKSRESGAGEAPFTLSRKGAFTQKLEEWVKAS